MQFAILSLFLATAASTALPELSARAPTFSKDLTSVVEALRSSQPADQVSEVLPVINKEAPAVDSLATPEALSSRNAARISRRAGLACNVLRVLFPGNYVDARDTTRYSAAMELNWSSNCELPAACFVTPKNSVQVALALKVVTLTGSKFAVRGGGHNTNPGWASIDGSGVLIDLQKLKTLSISDDRKVLSTGGGNRWGDVASFVDKYELSVVAGRHLQVGVGGVILGGGYPIFSSLYGLPCDNVKNFEVVLGDSTIVQASANSNPDLFKVLKGGGANFGIVTRFDLYTVPTHKIWYRSFALNATDGDQKKILRAAAQVQKNMETDPKAQLLFNAGFGMFIITFIYAEEASAPAVFRPLEGFKEIAGPPGTPPFLPATNGTVFKFHTSQTNPDSPGYREPTGIAIEVDEKLNEDVFNIWAANQKFATPGIITVLVWKPIASSAIRQGIAKGGNILGNRPVAQTWLGTPLQYPNPAAAAEAHGYTVRMERLVIEAARRLGKWLPFIFPNDATYSQNVVRSFGRENMELMRAASRKYDRQQVFQRLQNDGYLISKA